MQEVLREGSQLVRCLHEPAEHRVGIDLEDPRRPADAQALCEATDDVYDEVDRDALAMEQGAVMLWKVAFAGRTVELPPRATAGMARAGRCWGKPQNSDKMTCPIHWPLEPGEAPVCMSNCNSSSVTMTVTKKPSPMSSPSTRITNASNLSGEAWPSPNNFSVPSSDTSSNSKSPPFSARMRRARTVGRRSIWSC